MIYETKTYANAEGADEADALGLEAPPPEVIPFRFEMWDVTGYSPSILEDEPGTLLAVYGIGQIVITTPFEEFDQDYRSWRSQNPMRSEMLKKIDKRLARIADALSR